MHIRKYSLLHYCNDMNFEKKNYLKYYFPNMYYRSELCHSLIFQYLLCTVSISYTNQLVYESKIFHIFNNAYFQ